MSLSNQTSVMKAVTRPIRWSYEIVDIWFGEVRVRANQTVAMAGDLLRDLETGEIVELRGREGDTLLTKEV